MKKVMLQIECGLAEQLKRNGYLREDRTEPKGVVDPDYRPTRKLERILKEYFISLTKDIKVGGTD